MARMLYELYLATRAPARRACEAPPARARLMDGRTSAARRASSRQNAAEASTARERFDTEKAIAPIEARAISAATPAKHISVAVSRKQQVIPGFAAKVIGPWPADQQVIPQGTSNSVSPAAAEQPIGRVVTVQNIVAVFAENKILSLRSPKDGPGAVRREPSALLSSIATPGVWCTASVQPYMREP
jgi:hypothetical protein